MSTRALSRSTILRVTGAIILLMAVGLGCHRRLDSPWASGISGLVSTDIARAALETELVPLSRHSLSRYLESLDREAAQIRGVLPKAASASSTLDALNAHFFGPEGFAALSSSTGPEASSVAAVLEGRRGSCVGLTIVYLALAQRLGLDAHAVGTPVHLFVRVKLEDCSRNVDVMESGQEIYDETYRRRYRMDESSIANGVFMRELAPAEVIAHLASNQAVALSAQGRLDDALHRYDRALKLSPRLVVAWYNRGLDLMNAGRLQEALVSFSCAIELYPWDAKAYNSRGVALLRLRNWDAARTDFRRALELEPGMREAEENLRKLPASAALSP